MIQKNTAINPSGDCQTNPGFVYSWHEDNLKFWKPEPEHVLMDWLCLKTRRVDEFWDKFFTRSCSPSINRIPVP